MDLHRVSAAQGDAWTTLAAKMYEVPLAAAAASSPWLIGLHFTVLVLPNVPTQKGGSQVCGGGIDIAEQNFDRFCHRNGCDQLDHGAQHARRLASLVDAGGSIRKNACQARRLTGNHV